MAIVSIAAAMLAGLLAKAGIRPGYLAAFTAVWLGVGISASLGLLAKPRRREAGFGLLAMNVVICGGLTAALLFAAR